MRLALPTILVLSILQTTIALRHHRGTLLNASRRDRVIRRMAKEEKEKKNYRVGNLQVNVSPKSGNIAVSRGKMGKAKDKASTVNILIKSIQEVDAEGNAVGNGAEEEEVHSFASLEDTDFEIAVEEYVPIMIEDDTDAEDTDAEATDVVAGEDATNTDTVDMEDVETPSETDIVAADTASTEENIVALDTASTEEVTDSTDTDTDSSGLRRYLQAPDPVDPATDPVDPATDPVDPATDPVEPATDPVDGGAEGAKITISASLQTDSDLRVEMYLISGGGAVGTKSEKWAVQPGDTKFNIALKDWTFCDPCADDTTGEFVDVVIQIKGKGGPKPKKKGARIEEKEDGKGKKKGKKGEKRPEQAYDLGEGATLDLTSRVRVDGNWTDMPDGFPQLVNEGGKQYYTLRFPKFTDNIWYDPVVTFNEDFDSAATFRFVSQSTTYGAMLLAYILLL